MGRHYNLVSKGGTVSQYPSVTTIEGDLMNKPALMQWKLKLAFTRLEELISSQSGGSIRLKKLADFMQDAYTHPDQKSDEALDVGTQVHDLAEDAIKSEGIPAGLESRSDQVISAYMAWVDWSQKNIKKWLMSEQTVWCNEHRYAGTMDALAEMNDGKIYVIDFKTSKGFYSGMDLQVAAYRNCFEERGIQVDGCGILRLDKETGMPEWKDYSKDYERYRDCFNLLADAWWKLKKRRLKPGGPVRDLLRVERVD